MDDLDLRLRLFLESEGKPGLYPLLDAVRGKMLQGRYQFTRLLAIGRQSYVFLASDSATNHSVIIKQPAFDYRYPLTYNRKSAGQLRKPLFREAQVLRDCTSGHLPRLLDCFQSQSPIPAASNSPLLSEHEIFVVEEYIQSSTLSRIALEFRPKWLPDHRERSACRLATEFLVFWQSLFQRGWFYGDLNADNLLVDENGRLRMVDGGCAVEVAERVNLPSFTPACTTPVLYKALSTGSAVSGDLTTVLPMLAKVLHFVLTGCEPLNGRMPDLGEERMHGYSKVCRETLQSMLELDTNPEKLSHSQLMLDRWGDLIATLDK